MTDAPTVDLSEEDAALREEIHAQLPPEVALALSNLIDGDDIPRSPLDRDTALLFGMPYFWVIRDGKYTLLRGMSPYEVFGDPDTVRDEETVDVTL